MRTKCLLRGVLGGLCGTASLLMLLSLKKLSSNTMRVARLRGYIIDIIPYRLSTIVLTSAVIIR
ncbi:hypothetical protein F5883DRAFT_543817 [Diaporthe sp. PMI_573]|nr:hypothetical protein F5883DRAFT_543817 [Diaporthaceae sp. PMI_573]